ncbi:MULTISPECIES: lysophospholipid acyltransferase family protein [Asticcacaulis]|uniref:lysophospholipid acyltransferase family protein n=1 Tax=Asticcacaulis TaxID=76890 RepID=UPI001AE56B83|nr:MULTISPECIES: lysophospholipid acyltransferase family protein [Asticcacaulis]MBP2160639.1 lysophospholipid acyltransferase (LPLAT)-like uncharacterized protein [Asticcacaulis solisilvae]MDR6801684.1 lysophospholipid acyltransferase (LPLAT)-like uncharacterized protein [Asticcacaulis sp. BE141]
MKELLKRRKLQNILGSLISAYLKFCYATTRWQSEGRAEVEAVWASDTPVVLMFWHERLHFGHSSWPLENAQPIAVLSSTSKFGDVITKVTDDFGRYTIRGSSAKKSNPGKDKRGAQAFRDMLRWLRDGKGVATTPDGPRGPARTMTEGSLKLSQMSGAVLVCLGQSAKHYVEFNTWDRMRLPLPFNRGAMVWRVLPAVSSKIDEVEFERLRLEAERALNEATDRADDLTGAKRGTGGGRQIGWEEKQRAEQDAETDDGQ